MNTKDVIEGAKNYLTKEQQWAYINGFQQACHVISVSIRTGTYNRQDIDKIAYADLLDLTERSDDIDKNSSKP